MPVTPIGTVNRPAPAPEPAAAAADKIPFVATATVTTPETVLAVLSMYKSNTVPLVAPIAVPRSVPVGKVIVTAEAEVVVM
jgi:hypothetical protein